VSVAPDSDFAEAILARLELLALLRDELEPVDVGVVDAVADGTFPIEYCTLVHLSGAIGLDAYHDRPEADLPLRTHGDLEAEVVVVGAPFDLVVPSLLVEVRLGSALFLGADQPSADGWGVRHAAERFGAVRGGCLVRGAIGGVRGGRLGRRRDGRRGLSVTGVRAAGQGEQAAKADEKSRHVFLRSPAFRGRRIRLCPQGRIAPQGGERCSLREQNSVNLFSKTNGVE
jgi:hypothetical protein